MESNLTASDIALMNDRDGGFGGTGGAFFWVFALLILAGGGLGGLNRFGDYGQFATAASQQEILFGQQFQGLDNKIDRLGNGIADATFALNNTIHNAQDVVGGAITAEGRALQMQLANCCCENQKNTDALRYDMANMFANSTANTNAQVQKVLDALCTNRMADMQNQINALQLQNAMNGVVRYPDGWTYNAGAAPFCGGGCCNQNI